VLKQSKILAPSTKPNISNPVTKPVIMSSEKLFKQENESKSKPLESTETKIEAKPVEKSENIVLPDIPSE
jgi:hypothetical protein